MAGVARLLVQERFDFHDSDGGLLAASKDLRDIAAFVGVIDAAFVTGAGGQSHRSKCKRNDEAR
ncbi:hypothetical protein D3C71_2196130 [compost metagenome]